ncbi:MAG: D-alanyl-D-alanine carboxypeptidase [Catenulispora sp.]|nr:D-alanyl-D-alanine carboxypeptidase [Catenulispora sp.]
MTVRSRVHASVFCAITCAATGLAVLILGASGASGAAHAADPVSAPPDVDVASYVVADYDTGQILAERDPHRALYPASTLKVLTADTLIPRLSASLAVTPKAADFAAEPDGSVVGMTAGVTYTVADLWRATFLDSANDAVAELAHLAGGLDTTVALMQKKARALGAYDTVVEDADGYDADGQVTSAYDLALLARAGLGNASFRAYCSLRQATFPGPGGKDIVLKSHDPMLTGYPGMIGVKGGITTKAGHTYVGAAVRGGHTVIETLMLGGTDIFDQAARLMDWGLAADGHVAAVGKLGSGSSSPSASSSTTPTKSAATTGSSGSTSSGSTTPTPTPSGTSQSTTTPAPSPSGPLSSDALPVPVPTITLVAVRSATPTPAAPSSPPTSGEPIAAAAKSAKSGPASDPAAPDALWFGLLAAAGVCALPLGSLLAGRRSR